MGTNYYLHNVLSDLKGDEPLHIGKRSWGWAFALRVYCNEDDDPDLPRNIHDWRKRWSSLGSYIKNEYGELITVNDLEDLINTPGKKLMAHEDPYLIVHNDGIAAVYINVEFS